MVTTPEERDALMRDRLIRAVAAASEHAGVVVKIAGGQWRLEVLNPLGKPVRVVEGLTRRHVSQLCVVLEGIAAVDQAPFGGVAS